MDHTDQLAEPTPPVGVLTIPEPQAGVPTSRLGLPVPSENDPADVPADIGRLATTLDIAALAGQGTLAQRPAASVYGRLFYVVGDATPANNGILWWDTGTAWARVAAAPPRLWRAAGTGAGDGTNAGAPGTWSSAASPRIAFPPTGAVAGQWYRARATCILAASEQPAAGTSMMTGAMLSTDGANALPGTYTSLTFAPSPTAAGVSYQPITMESTFQAASVIAGNIAIYYTSNVPAGVVTYLGNTAAPPVITLEEIATPS